jgi:3-hydroxybutyryl-CoA dehydrogenase
MIESICVCGAGTMGSGIAQVAAQGGFHTILYDVNSEMLEKAKASIEKSLRLLEEKGKIPANEKKELILERLQFTADINACIADVVIEAIVEKVSVKTGLFNQLAELNHSETIFATNTSSLSVTAIAAGVMNPHRVAGIHFFNPATIMKLVEVVKTEYTTKQVIDAIVVLVKAIGKTPVLCKDAPGFIVNHVARPYYLEALRLIEQGLCTVETVDETMEASGFKMGPFKLMDLIGNDINYAVSCQVYEALGKPIRMQPSVVQQQKVAKGELGRKTGKGYYGY